MMGKKKLAAIREELANALSQVDQDPIRWLEERIAASQRQGRRTDVLESLKQVLEAPAHRKPSKRRVKAKR